MTHRFLSYTPEVGQNLKNGLFTGNFNKFLKVQPKTVEAGQSKKFLSESSGPKKENKGATDVGENGAADDIIERKTTKKSSSPMSSSATKDPKFGSLKLRGVRIRKMSLGQDDGKKTSAGPIRDHVDDTQIPPEIECTIM